MGDEMHQCQAPWLLAGNPFGNEGKFKLRIRLVHLAIGRKANVKIGYLTIYSIFS